MEIFDVYAAKLHLSELVARDSQPMVRLVPAEQEKPMRRFGTLKGKVIVPDEFFDPLPEGELEAWSQ